VPSKTHHLQIARDNEQLAGHFNLDSAPARGWASTIYFYAALHYVEAFFSTKGSHSADHRTRDSNLCRHTPTMDIYDEYCELKNISTSARYLGRYPNKTELSVEVMPALAKVRAEMEKHF
jgi:hypothetical protein